MGHIVEIVWPNSQKEPIHTKDLPAAAIIQFDNLKERQRIEPKQVEFPKIRSFARVQCERDLSSGNLLNLLDI